MYVETVLEYVQCPVYVHRHCIVKVCVCTVSKGIYMYTIQVGHMSVINMIIPLHSQAIHYDIPCRVPIQGYYKYIYYI